MRVFPLLLAFFVGFMSTAAYAVVAAPPANCNPAEEICFDPIQPLKPCGVEVGATTMDYDKRHIIACLLDDSGNKVWKAMTTATSSTTNYPCKCYHLFTGNPSTGGNRAEAFRDCGSGPVSIGVRTGAWNGLGSGTGYISSYYPCM